MYPHTHITTFQFFLTQVSAEVLPEKKSSSSSGSTNSNGNAASSGGGARSGASTPSRSPRSSPRHPAPLARVGAVWVSGGVRGLSRVMEGDVGAGFGSLGGY